MDAFSWNLSILGMDELEERVYRWLLVHPEPTAAEMSRALKLPAPKVQRLLSAIENKGLATHLPKHPRCYLPAAPNIALKTLLHHRLEELQSAEPLIDELQTQFEALHREDDEHILELVHGRDTIRLVFLHLVESAKNEVLALTRPPMHYTNLSEPQEAEQGDQRKAQHRGVRIRSVYDSDMLSMEQLLQFIQADIKAGESVRILPNLPIKLVMVDRKIAIIPLHVDSPDDAVLIRPSALLDSLGRIFEDIWSRASPIAFPESDVIETVKGDSRGIDATDGLLKMLVAGANDKTIVRELGISERSLTRSIQRLKQQYGARTRLQLGWLLGQRMNDG